MSLSTRIVRDLKKRLRSRQPLAVPLTLDALSAHYDVSVTPVRAAIAELVADGLLIKGENRRLLPALNGNSEEVGDTDSEDFPPTRPPRELLKAVEHDLVRLSFDEQEVFIREEAAAHRYGISRSAMRNLLHRLAGTGLLLHIPRRGWKVRPFRQADMESFLEVRALLEVKALELAQHNLESDVIQGILERNCPPASPDGVPRIDNSLHAYIIHRAGNPYIQDFFERHGRYYEILFDWEDLDRDAALQAVQQHRQILESILRQNWDAAREALSWHIRSNHPVLRQLASRAAQRDTGTEVPA